MFLILCEALVVFSGLTLSPASQNYGRLVDRWIGGLVDWWWIGGLLDRDLGDIHACILCPFAFSLLLNSVTQDIEWRTVRSILFHQSWLTYLTVLVFFAGGPP